jgi:hypothetical protein
VWFLEPYRFGLKEPAKTAAKEMRQLRGTRPCSAEMYRVPRSDQMSEVTPSPPAPSKSLEEQAVEFLRLLEQIISAAPEMADEIEKVPA